MSSNTYPIKSQLAQAHHQKLFFSPSHIISIPRHRPQHTSVSEIQVSDPNHQTIQNWRLVYVSQHVLHDFEKHVDASMFVASEAGAGPWADVQCE